MLKLDPNWNYYQRDVKGANFVVLYSDSPENLPYLSWRVLPFDTGWRASTDKTLSDLKSPIFIPLTYEQAEALVTLSYLGGQVGDE